MPEISLLYGGILGLLMALLSIQVPIRRASLNAPWGDAGDSKLSTRIRVFGNFIEYVPYAIVLMALIEMSSGAELYLHICGSVLVSSRVVHAISLKDGDSPLWRKIGRGIGAMSTWLVLTVLSVYAVLLSVS